MSRRQALFSLRVSSNISGICSGSSSTKALKPNGPDESGDDHTYMIKDTRPGKNENGKLGKTEMAEEVLRRAETLSQDSSL